ncbi:MAG: PIN/TRAM domain-containing protein [Christensenellales bacterium]|jgi:uncharacterized protein YacL
MIRKLIRLLMTLLGVAICVAFIAIAYSILEYFQVDDPFNNWEPWLNIGIFSAVAAVGALISYVNAPKWIDALIKIGDELAAFLRRTSIKDLVFGIIGLICGLILSSLISYLYKMIPIPWLEMVLVLCTYFVLGYSGIKVFVTRQDELVGLFASRREHKGHSIMASPPVGVAKAKILDTSVIIDGRIFDVCVSGFLEGEIVIPNFVLLELQHIADSSDPMRRGRGRRGLAILQRIRNELELPVRIESAEIGEVEAVDEKLVMLAKRLDGIIITNDYNLNQVAQVHGLKVLNINELSNAVKPALVAGESIHVKVLREGKEPGQGVAYLEDGTMIVVEEGQRYVGRDVEAEVTSVLQTSAGRMIFTRIKLVK